MKPSYGARLLALVLVCTAALVGGLFWFAHTGDQVPVFPESRVVFGSPAEGWKTIAYLGTEVDVPATWERQDLTHCEFDSERWVPPGPSSCTYQGGLAFYGSATFDPYTGPGVVRNPRPGNGEPAWGGYTTAGQVAVHASDPDRGVVQQVLDSVRVTDPVTSQPVAP